MFNKKNWVHVQIDSYVQQMCKGIVMDGYSIIRPHNYICNIIRTMRMKSARKQHVGRIYWQTAIFQVLVNTET